MAEIRLLIIDGHAYAYRSYYAIRQLRSPSGRPTNGIYGFVKAVERLRTRFNPSHEVVVWDGGLAVHRLDLLPAYKAQRPAMPEDLVSQFDGMVDWVVASGGVSHCYDGVEADDWIATLTSMAVNARAQITIASGDKDFMQLVSEFVRLEVPGGGVADTWGEEAVLTKTGVKPTQIVDWLSLVGDSVDNIAGVPGIGPKTATKLLVRFGSCERIIATLDEIESETLRTTINTSVETIRRNAKMIRLRDDLPCEIALQDLERRTPNINKLRELYGQWGFSSMEKGLQESGPSQYDLFG
ncbi:MAG: 5'-3' exonuclease [Limisphaerales bacterium]